jgi:hypothetical protein
MPDDARRATIVRSERRLAREDTGDIALPPRARLRDEDVVAGRAVVHFAPIDEHALDEALELEWRAAEDDDVGILSDLEAPDA